MIITKNNKIAVGILGATGMVGQKFIELLSNHPWFEITALAASERSQNKKFKDAMRWMMLSELSEDIGNRVVQECLPNLPCSIVFSGLDSSVAGTIEDNFANNGYIVISNSSNHRMQSDVPLLIPEVNSDHLQLVKKQKYQNGGMIVTNPNCSVIGLTIALKPILDHFGIEKTHIVTLQAISGAGYPGVPSFDILDNVIPFIAGEEAKVETEPLKILGSYLSNNTVSMHDMKISAQCNRVPVIDGHMACVSVKLQKSADKECLINLWNSFRAEPQHLTLPSAPAQPLVYLNEERYPQPKLHRQLANGMAVSIGRLQPCSLFDWKFVLLSHNTVRGAAGCALLNAELMIKKGFVPGSEKWMK